jgi:hypothetical protein
LSGSGPIIRNRTFFFASWEQQIVLEKQVINTKVLTDCARKGIYRYISDWVPQHAHGTPVLAGNRARPSVNTSGVPLEGLVPVVNPATGATHEFEGYLRFESIFGPLTTENRGLLDVQGGGGARGNCDALVFNGPAEQFGVSEPWDRRDWGAGRAYRDLYDRTGYVDRFTNGVPDGRGGWIVKMPPVNNWDIGDGLNLAGHRWTYRASGIASIFGTGGDPERKALTVKIDHNINNAHRLSGTYSFERFFADTAQAQWPQEYGGFIGNIYRRPHNATISLTSTLSPTLLNEARFGYSRSVALNSSPTEDERYGPQMLHVLDTLMPTGAGSVFAGTLFANQTIHIGVGEALTLFHFDPVGGTTTSHPLSVRDPGQIPATWGGHDHRLLFANTMTWMKGAHSFKGGIEIRLQDSYQNAHGLRAVTGTGGLSWSPTVYGGLADDLAAGARATHNRRAGMLAAARTSDRGFQDVMSGSVDTAATTNGNFPTIYNMMTYFSGSISQIRQYYYSSGADRTRWNDALIGENLWDYTLNNREISFFFKDDWRVTSDLTLNLGVRYEYYGVPWASDGRTLRLQGGADNVFGIQPGGWNRWMNNREYVYSDTTPAPVSIYEFVGPGSPNTGRGAWNPDRNNFAPHVGFAWQLPWFGRGTTTLRGGYAINFAQVDTFDQFGVQFVDVGAAGTTHTYSYRGLGDHTDINNTNYYMDLSDLERILPIMPPDTIRAHQTRLNGQFSGGATALSDDLNNPYVHSLNMSLTRNFGRSLTVDLRYIGSLSRDMIVATNLNQVDYLANDFYQELDIVRRGGESLVINSLFPSGTFDNVADRSGSEQLRRWGSQQANLTRGLYQAVANSLATANANITPPDPSILGMVNRVGCLPGDRVVPNDLNTPCERATPWNYFWTNPQFSTATQRYNAALSNYHSMQAQVTLRPTGGFNFQATWTWSRMLSDTGAWTDLLGDRFNDRTYTLHGQHRSHTFNTFGSYSLPFGPNGLLFRDASGAFRKAIEGWQISWITAFSTGAPASVTGSAAMWGDNSPILVRPEYWDNKAGKVQWNMETFEAGYYFGQRFTNYVLDTGICDARIQGYGEHLVAPPAGQINLFRSHCSSSNHPITGLSVPVAGAPRALALASGEVDAAGNMLPMLYESDFRGADGIVYAAGTPIIVFRNADQRLGANAAGDFRPNQLTAQGRISFDMAMSKSIEFMEGKRLEVRVDAQNILNHPTPSSSFSTWGPSQRGVAVGNPNLAINSTTPFGYLATKVGRRTFQGRLRLSF